MTPQDLKNIAHEINTQDNRITAHPLFCVFEKERIYGLDPDYSDVFEWYKPEQNSVLRPSELTEEKAEQEGYEKVYYVERDRFINAHFTEKAANEYIKINGHNLNEPFVFVTSLSGCNEMIEIRKALADNGLHMDLNLLKGRNSQNA